MGRSKLFSSLLTVALLGVAAAETKKESHKASASSAPQTVALKTDADKGNGSDEKLDTASQSLFGYNSNAGGGSGGGFPSPGSSGAGGFSSGGGFGGNSGIYAGQFGGNGLGTGGIGGPSSFSGGQGFGGGGSQGLFGGSQGLSSGGFGSQGFGSQGFGSGGSGFGGSQGLSSFGGGGFGGFGNGGFGQGYFPAGNGFSGGNSLYQGGGGGNGYFGNGFGGSPFSQGGGGFGGGGFNSYPGFGFNSQFQGQGVSGQGQQDRNLGFVNQAFGNPLYNRSPPVSSSQLGSIQVGNRLDVNSGSRYVPSGGPGGFSTTSSSPSSQFGSFAPSSAFGGRGFGRPEFSPASSYNGLGSSPFGASSGGGFGGLYRPSPYLSPQFDYMNRGVGLRSGGASLSGSPISSSPGRLGTSSSSGRYNPSGGAFGRGERLHRFTSSSSDESDTK